jgi:PPOX class probable F420-dependent enzyme
MRLLVLMRSAVATVPFMAFSFSEETFRLLTGRNYAVLATVNADGSPHSSGMWVGHEGNDLLFSTAAGRVKHRNMLRDPRVSVTILETANPENYVELRGRVMAITPDPDRMMHITLADKYGKDPGEPVPGQQRLVVRVVVDKAAGYAA